MIIHGGRNDMQYQEVKDCALNDLHMLDLMTLEW